MQNPTEPAGTRSWHCGRFRLRLDRPLIAGIVNVTPDSFSDGGLYLDFEKALAHAHQLLDEGADLLDIGGESTRPGAPTVPIDEELRRVIPLVKALQDCGRPISVDTRKVEVMRAAVAAGADVINDVAALTASGACEAVAASEVGVCLMHMQGDPATMQLAPTYGDVVAEVAGFLRSRAEACEAAGIARGRICLDPGYGFGKTAAHNWTLLRHQRQLASLGYPVLAGLSRKSMIGAVTGRKQPGERLAGSIAAAVLAVQQGADIVRVHDVAETRDALAVWAAFRDMNDN